MKKAFFKFLSLDRDVDPGTLVLMIRIVNVHNDMPTTTQAQAKSCWRHEWHKGFRCELSSHFNALSLNQRHFCNGNAHWRALAAHPQ